MFQLALSVFAWTGVVIGQFMVHYLVGLRYKLTDEDDDDINDKNISHVQDGALFLVLPQLMDEGWQQQRIIDRSNNICNSIDTHVDTTDRSTEIWIQSLPESHLHTDMMYDDEPPLDGDEPRNFYRLLEQTGCEMVMSCHSMEDLVLEEIRKIDEVL